MKNALLLTTLIFMASTLMTPSYAAKATGCNYTEHMYIEAPGGAHIMSLEGDNLGIQKVGDRYFLIIGTCDGHSDGTVKVKVGFDETHYALLTIKDSQFYLDPQVIKQIIQGGFSFEQIYHDGFFANHKYTLRFAQNKDASSQG